MGSERDGCPLPLWERGVKIGLFNTARVVLWYVPHCAPVWDGTQHWYLQTRT